MFSEQFLSIYGLLEVEQILDISQIILTDKLDCVK